MAEETFENEDSINFDENETHTENETELTVDDYNKLKAEKEALEASNKKLYARLKKSSDVKPSVEKQDTGIDQAEFTRLKLKVDYGITDSDALDFVMKNGGEAAMKNPLVKSAIDGLIAQKKAEQAASISDDGKSEFDRKYTQDQLRNMSAEELEKILPHS